MWDEEQDHVILSPGSRKGTGLVVGALPVRCLIAITCVRSVGLVSSALGSGGIVGPLGPLGPSLGECITLKGQGYTHTFSTAP